jgi:DNA adenine methylase
VTYPGGKNGAGVYQQIINVMPPHSVYIEPFLGGGAVMRMKRPAALNIGVDLDRAVIQMFRPVAAKLARGDRAAASPNPALGAGTHRQKQRASSAAGSDDGTRFEIHQQDAIDFLKRFRWRGGELVYCDPPYMPEACTSRCRYRYGMTRQQHCELLRVLRGLPCHVIISGYWTPLYEWMLRGWHHVTYQTVNRAAKRTTEHLWMNFAEPVELHDYRYLGANWRERERIKRKKARWVARLGRMPVLERRALLAAIAQTQGGNAK